MVTVGDVLILGKNGFEISLFVSQTVDLRWILVSKLRADSHASAIKYNLQSYVHSI